MDHGPACHGGWEASQVAQRDGQVSAWDTYNDAVREVVLGPSRQDLPGFVDGKQLGCLPEGGRVASSPISEGMDDCIAVGPGGHAGEAAW